MKLFEFKPKLVSCLKNYSKETFMADLMAGIIVGIVALPLAIAFGIASGVSPEKGIITAIIAGFIISLLGGSKVQIGGPTGAFIVIIYGIIQQYGEAGLIVATLMAGVLLILLGVFKLGAVIKFIPYPIIVGFTSGIAVTIFTTQIADIFGLSFGDEKVPGDFVGKWMIYFRHFDTINWWNTIVSIVSIIIIAITPKFSKKIPGSLIAIIVVTVAVYLMKTFGGIDCIQTIGDRFTIKSELPDAVVPALDWEAIRELFPVAITIAVLGAIESLLSATVADGVIGDRHDSNTELIAQGAANIIAPLFGGIPATGAIARTMTNINNGGKTPIAGIIHAVILDSTLPDAACTIYPDGVPCRGTGHRILQHEWMACIQSFTEESEIGCHRIADYFLPDRYLRLDSRYRSRIDNRLRPLYETCYGDYRNLGDYR